MELIIIAFVLNPFFLLIIEQGGESKAKLPVARRRGWLEGWRKDTKKPSKLSLADLKEKTDNFGASALVGKGSYGTVYYAVLDNGKQAVIKELDYHLHGGSESKFFTKVSRVFGLKHENIVEMLGYCAEENRGMLAYEFATRGSLYGILHGGNGVENAQPGPVLSWMQRVRVAVDVAKALKYLHEKVQPSIIHGHIRSSNVLLFEDYKAKIMDLSLSNQSNYIDQNLHEITARVPNWSLEYFPPEYIRMDDHFHPCKLSLETAYDALTKECDVHSLGVVLLELLTGRRPFDRETHEGQEDLLTWALDRLNEGKVEQCIDPRLKGEYPPNGVAKLAKLAQQCLQYDPELRPNISILLKELSPLLAQKPPRGSRDV